MSLLLPRIPARQRSRSLERTLVGLRDPGQGGFTDAWAHGTQVYIEFETDGCWYGECGSVSVGPFETYLECFEALQAALAPHGVTLLSLPYREET